MATGLDTTTIQMLAQLMSGAKGANKNVSGLMGNLDNPILLALAGQLDPYYGQAGQMGGSNGIYSSFANDASTPAAVKAIMDWVDQGMNKYQIEAQINNLDDKVKKDSGYTDEQLIGMGSTMANDRAKGTDKSVFEKAGLRNPNDIYGIEDQPFTDANKALFTKYANQAETYNPEIDTLSQRESVARQKLKTSTSDMGSYTLSRKDALAAARTMSGNIMPGDYGLHGKLLGAGKNGVTLTRDDYENVSPFANQAIRIIKNKGTRNVDVAAWKDVAAASMNRAALERKKYGAQQRAGAVAEGNLAGVNAAGRTPFTDQVAGLMRFLQSAK